MSREQKQFRYVALKADFEEQILSGKMPVGSLFPTEREVQEYGIGYSRNTVRMVIKTMLAEGSLLRKKDRRLIVWDKRLTTAKVKLAFLAGKQQSSLNDILTMFYRALLVQSSFLEIPFCFYDPRQQKDKTTDPGRFNAVFVVPPETKDLPLKAEKTIWLVNEPKAEYVVAVDDYQGGGMAADFLFGQGCRSVIFMNHSYGSIHNIPFQHRENGFADQCRKNSMSCSSLIIPNTTERSLRSFLLSKKSQQLIQSADGIFFSSDYLAVKFIRVLREIRMKCTSGPATWIGFDGGFDSEYLPCPLNTLKQPIRELAWAALKLALAAKPERKNILLKPELIIRCPRNDFHYLPEEWKS